MNPFGLSQLGKLDFGNTFGIFAWQSQIATPPIRGFCRETVSICPSTAVNVLD
jgi:hypothetical protein